MPKIIDERPDLEICEALLREKNYKKAISIAKKYKSWGFSDDQRSDIARAYECFFRPSFYKELGYDPEECIQKAVQLLKDKFNINLY